MSETEPRNLDELSQLIETLKSAQAMGFSLGSSPVEPLIEVMVDLALQIRKSLKEGSVFWEKRSNKILKFSKTEVDALNNPKVIRSEVQRHLAWDPQISNFFGEIAQNLILVKRTHQLPDHLYCSGRGRQQDHQPGKQRVKFNSAQYHFHRRRSRRSKGN